MNQQLFQGYSGAWAEKGDDDVLRKSGRIWLGSNGSLQSVSSSSPSHQAEEVSLGNQEAELGASLFSFDDDESVLSSAPLQGTFTCTSHKGE